MEQELTGCLVERQVSASVDDAEVETIEKVCPPLPRAAAFIPFPAD